MDLENYIFPKGITLVYYTSFQGFVYDGISILQPSKEKKQTFSANSEEN